MILRMVVDPLTLPAMWSDDFNEILQAPAYLGKGF